MAFLSGISFGNCVGTNRYVRRILMSFPAYFNRKPESIKAKANKREATVYKHLCSGALNAKGDFSSKDCLFDNKSTDKKSIRVTEEMLDKLMKDTLEMGKQQAVLILDLPNYYVRCLVIKKKNL